MCKAKIGGRACRGILNCLNKLEIDRQIQRSGIELQGSKQGTWWGQK